MMFFFKKWADCKVHYRQDFKNLNYRVFLEKEVDGKRYGATSTIPLIKIIDGDYHEQVLIALYKKINVVIEKENSEHSNPVLETEKASDFTMDTFSRFSLDRGSWESRVVNNDWGKEIDDIRRFPRDRWSWELEDVHSGHITSYSMTMVQPMHDYGFRDTGVLSSKESIPEDVAVKRINEWRKKHPEESNCLDIMKKKAYPVS